MRCRSIAWFVSLALLAGALGPSVAAQASAHVRGIVLGTTPVSIDVGLADRTDVHLEMATEPHVAIAEPGDEHVVRPGVLVSVVTVRDGPRERAHAIAVVPISLLAGSGFVYGRRAWDSPAGRGAIVTGRVVDRTDTRTSFSLVLAGGHDRSQIVVPRGVPIVVLRSGSRAALRSPQHVFVFTEPPGGGLSDRVRSIIVADGTLGLPL